MRVNSILILLALCIASFVRSASCDPKHPFLGISPQDEKYYKSSSDSIKCKDGSKKFSKSQLNDDFCDCPDGTDEPGTSACPTAKFYCQNAGHAPHFLFSSRVNDGICDCCDGSDEYDGKVKCPNTCWEAGKVYRDRLIKKIATYQEGAKLRKLEIEQSKIAIAKDEAELTKLKNEEKILKGLVQDLKESKEQIEKAEEKAKLQKEKEENQKKEAEEALKGNGKLEEGNVENEKVEEDASTEDKPTESTHDDTIGNMEDSSLNENLKVDDRGDDPAAAVENSDTSKTEAVPLNGVDENLLENKHESASPRNKDDSAVATEIDHDAGSEVSPDEDKKAESDASETAEEVSREELGRLVASRWTGESTENQGGTKVNADESHEEMPKDTHDKQYDNYASETDEDIGKYDDDVDDEPDESYEEENHDDTTLYKSDLDDEPDFSDTTSSNNPSWLEKIQRTVRNILDAVNLFQTPVNVSEAAHVRKEYDESSAKLSKIQSKISSLTQKLKHDFGAEKEFYAFYDRCFENKQNKYVYKVCPYKQASQEEGHTTTRLGRWDKFEDSYRLMVFSNGDRCWNGPDRSMKVKLRCGLKNEITDIDEPSRCEYVALLSTPALCLENKLKELEDKLDLMNKEPRLHDEL